jgi:predicted MFS family arabinose efflux permease
VPISNPWRGLRGLPSDVWIIFATTLVNRAGVMALPFLVLYLTQYLHVSAALAGFAITTYGVGSLITGPIAGRLSDRLGPFRVMQVSLALTGVILLVIPLAHDFTVVAVLTFFWAVVADANRPATLSALTDLVPPEQRKAAIALHRLAVNLGMSVGPAVGGFLAVVSFPLLFVVDGITALASAALLTALLWLRRRSLAADLAANREAAAMPTTDSITPALRVALSPPVWKDRTALIFFAGVLLVSIVFMQNQGAMPLYLVRDLGYKESLYGMLFVLNTLLIVAMEVPLNLAMAHWSHRRSLMLGAVLTAFGFGALAVAHSKEAVAATVLIWTFGEMIFFPSSTAYVADIAPPGRNGAYMGAFVSMFSVALIIGPWAGTAALDRFGPALAWSGVLVCGLIGVIVVAAVHPRRDHAS